MISARVRLWNQLKKKKIDFEPLVCLFFKESLRPHQMGEVEYTGEGDFFKFGFLFFFKKNEKQTNIALTFHLDLWWLVLLLALRNIVACFHWIPLKWVCQVTTAIVSTPAFVVPWSAVVRSLLLLQSNGRVWPCADLPCTNFLFVFARSCSNKRCHFGVSSRLFVFFLLPEDAYATPIHFFSTHSNALVRRMCRLWDRTASLSLWQNPWASYPKQAVLGLKLVFFWFWFWFLIDFFGRGYFRGITAAAGGSGAY